VKERLYLCQVKIAVNTRLLLKDRLEGIGRFTAHIFEELSAKHPEVEWIFVFDRPWDESFIYNGNIRAVKIFPPTRHPLLWHWWFQWSLPRFLAKEKVDLFISPDGMIPLWGKCPSIAVIHDLNYEHQPKNLDPIAGNYMRYFYPKFAARAKRVVTVSDFCRQDLINTYHLASQKVDVVANSYSPVFNQPPALSKVEVQKQYSNGHSFFIYLGALNPRKNLEGLLAGYQHYRQSGGQHHLLIVGERMLWTQSIEKAFANHAFQKDIHFTGRLKDERLPAVVAAAQALCLVSHFEGFGIPILEAYASGVPVICANNTAMPEVAGAGGLLVNSRDARSIGEAMHDMESEELRTKLILEGQKQVQKYSWEHSARAMWLSIQKSLSADG
jgi:glycosyltransferase involved in cell wall biosynthesis